MSSAVNTNDNSAAAATSRIPGDKTLQGAIKLAITEDKPVLMDYWSASIESRAFVGARENKEKLLVKSEEEYTSPIQKIYKVENDFIIMTENSIYLVSATIPTRRIQ
jgi:hypothetical protein